MIDYGISEYARLLGSISLSQSDKERIAEQLFRENLTRKEIPKKYVAAASIFAVLAVGTVMAVRGMKQDVNMM